ncbi:hypothetical protein [Citrobacter youngae]|uniref:hypothetical protein n=1 Tax=Citrobacter youngae TaxID=133448 RepID=UPI00287BFA72|nr:hypothetical protein [Citrobacter youngae]
MSDNDPVKEISVGPTPADAAGNEQRQQAEKVLWDTDALLQERQSPSLPEVQTSGMSLKAGTIVQKGELSRTVVM